MKRAAILALLAWAPCLSAQTAERAPAELVPVTAAQFQGLRWLEGVWRGSGGDYPSFFEDFRWTDDSTVDRHTYADSTLARVTETSQLLLRDGRLHQARNGTLRGGAVLLRGDSLRFASGVLWIRRSNDHWTAILGGGRVVYELRRYRR
jgi:hypothetical protein